jgi:LemA protein
MNKIVGMVLLATAMLAVCIASFYHNLMIMSHNADDQWSKIDNLLQCRQKLAASVIRTVKGHNVPEQQAILAVSDARKKLVTSRAPLNKLAANGELNRALKRLSVLAEKYPELKQDTALQALINKLADKEDLLADACKRYNYSVQIYNSTVRSLPAILFAGSFGFKPKEYFAVRKVAPVYSM